MESAAPASAAPAQTKTKTFKERWWSVFDARIGSLPVPVYLVLLAVLSAMTLRGKLAFHWVNIVTAVSTVLALTATGFLVGRLVGMYPIEAAIVNATHSGLGGTGDVAILTAANRMELMPFAQIATRIGGAITVMTALAVFAYLH
jgi:malate:Na+ symporter